MRNKHEKTLARWPINSSPTLRDHLLGRSQIQLCLSLYSLCQLTHCLLLLSP